MTDLVPHPKRSSKRQVRGFCSKAPMHFHCDAKDQSSLMPTDLVSALHLAISDLSSFPSSSGEEPPAT